MLLLQCQPDKKWRSAEDRQRRASNQWLYLILDLYSRNIVGWEVHESDHADHAIHLVKCTALAEGIAALFNKPVLHGDNGATLKATPTRNWSPVLAVTLNPECDSIIKAHSAGIDTQPMAA